MHILKEKNKTNSGFTLVETLISISIFSLSILIIFSLVSNSISDLSFVKKKIVASYLAQEGIELFRNLRDTYVSFDPGGVQVGWDAFLSKLEACDATTESNKKCYFKTKNLFDGEHTVLDIAVSSCPAGSCPSLYYFPGGKFNEDNNGVLTEFVREMKIEKVIESGNEIKVYSTIVWEHGSETYSVTFTENLYHWIERTEEE